VPALPPGFLAVVSITANREDGLIYTEVSEERPTFVPELLRALSVLSPSM
jgi:hypothetical protein